MPNRNQLSLAQLTDALEKQFASSASDWRLRQVLDQRKQREGEKLSSYITDIRQQCSRLNLPVSEWRHHFVKGLRSDIKDYVVLQQPATFEAAENFAKLKEFKMLVYFQVTSQLRRQPLLCIRPPQA